FAGTRLSEQPIHKYSGDCWRESFRKNSGSCSRMLSAHCLLLSKICLSVRIKSVCSGNKKYAARDGIQKPDNLPQQSVMARIAARHRVTQAPRQADKRSLKLAGLAVPMNLP